MRQKICDMLIMNQNGISVVYIGRNAGWNNNLANGFINWEYHEDALEIAKNSPFQIDGKNIFIVDTDRDLQGFFYIESMNGNKANIKCAFQPYYLDRSQHKRLPSAPHRPAGAVMGYYLEKKEFDRFLMNLKGFVNVVLHTKP